MKTKKLKLKPRRMWANYCLNGVVVHSEKAHAEYDVDYSEIAVAVPVAVVPLDDVEALIEESVRVFADEIERHGSYDESMHLALTAIGVLPKKHKAKGRK